ncbi:MAG: hypothetical protein M3066_19675, partial [Actinomycetota bacterium]|nr:hypothetical protein [Actinomycetota bacterium]
AAGVTACSVITEDDAGAALGADPGPGEGVTHLGASSCAYGNSPSLVTVNLLPSGGKVAYDHAWAGAATGQLVAIPGVGDAAFGATKGPMASVEFYKGDALVTVVLIVGETGTPPQDRALTLAKSAARRM